jgi:uncharacterized alkaline shock family protein YloU
MFGAGGHAAISHDILASYAADAAREVAGVVGLVESLNPGRRGVRVADDEGRLRVELRVVGAWGASLPEVGLGVQRSVRDYLQRMAGVDPEAVDVVIDEIAAS